MQLTNCSFIGATLNGKRREKRVTDVCPVSCKSCPAFVSVFVGAAAETAPILENADKNAFPFYYVFGAIGGAITVVAGLVLFRFRRYRYNEDDDLTFSQFVMTPSEWLA